MPSATRCCRRSALRLRDTVRAGDTVARLGGDEFCVLLEDLESDEEAERTATRLLEA
jgi:GGDEF domain-containing protein